MQDVPCHASDNYSDNYLTNQGSAVFLHHLLVSAQLVWNLHQVDTKKSTRYYLKWKKKKESEVVLNHTMQWKSD